MQRSVLLVLPLLAFAAEGCGNPCSGPTQLDGRVYNGYATVFTFGAVSDDPAEREGYPAYESPANGSHLWEFRWGGANSGPVQVVIDDQAFSGTGVWDLVDCGTFSVQVPEQTFIDEEGNSHLFVLDGSFMAYGQRLEGSMYWAEVWTLADGSAEGTFVGQEIQLRGYQPL